jgi:hypothetical protein
MFRRIGIMRIAGRRGSWVFLASLLLWPAVRGVLAEGRGLHLERRRRSRALRQIARPKARPRSRSRSTPSPLPFNPPNGSTPGPITKARCTMVPGRRPTLKPGRSRKKTARCPPFAPAGCGPANNACCKNCRVANERRPALSSNRRGNAPESLESGIVHHFQVSGPAALQFDQPQAAQVLAPLHRMPLATRRDSIDRMPASRPVRIGEVC